MRKDPNGLKLSKIINSLMYIEHVLAVKGNMKRWLLRLGTAKGCDKRFSLVEPTKV